VETRRGATRILRDDRAKVVALIERLPPRTLSTAGLGGGTWSPKDLLGHLESWEEHALEALDAWTHGRRARIDADLRSRGLNTVNRDEVTRKASRPASKAVASAAATHDRLLRALSELTDVAWNAPASSRSRRTLGARVGSILGGPAGAFRHDRAHLAELKEFVREHGDESRAEPDGSGVDQDRRAKLQQRQ
jgi:hypothetical protein